MTKKSKDKENQEEEAERAFIRRVYEASSPDQRVAILKKWLSILPWWLQEFPDGLDEILDILTPKQFVAVIKPEDREQILELVLERFVEQQQTIRQDKTNSKKPQQRKSKKGKLKGFSKPLKGNKQKDELYNISS